MQFHGYRETGKFYFSRRIERFPELIRWQHQQAEQNERARKKGDPQSAGTDARWIEWCALREAGYRLEEWEDIKRERPSIAAQVLAFYFEKNIRDGYNHEQAEALGKLRAQREGKGKGSASAAGAPTLSDLRRARPGWAKKYAES